MFENLKNLHTLKQMQDEFKKEQLTIEKRGVKVTMDGNFGIQDIKLNPELDLENQQNALRDALNEAREEIQKLLAKKMMVAGFNL